MPHPPRALQRSALLLACRPSSPHELLLELQLTRPIAPLLPLVAIRRPLLCLHLARRRRPRRVPLLPLRHASPLLTFTVYLPSQSPPLSPLVHSPFPGSFTIPPLSHPGTPELPRDEPSSLRVHLCPELPDQAQEMEFEECSNWGRSECVGASQLLHLYQVMTTR